MKKILFLFSILFLTSCQETTFSSTAMENTKKATTVNILNTMDTAVIKIDTLEHKLYIVENNLVTREFKWYNNDEAPATLGTIMLFILFGFCLGFIIRSLID